MWQNRPFVALQEAFDQMSDSSITTSDTELRIIAQLAEELSIRPQQVAAVIELLKDGATVPFIVTWTHVCSTCAISKIAVQRF
jgi:hypothetical protein